MELWETVNTQWRTTGFGVVGLDYPACWDMAERIGIPVTRDLIRKIRALEHVELKKNIKTSKPREGKNQK